MAVAACSDSGEDLEVPPTISGFLLRSKVVSGWSGMAVDGYGFVGDDTAATSGCCNNASTATL